MPKLSFSQRKGLEPLPTAQKEKWNRVTVNAVWNVIDGVVNHVTQGTLDFYHPEIKFVRCSFQSINLELLGNPNDVFFDVFSKRGVGAPVFSRLQKSPYREYYFNAPYNKRLDFIQYFVAGDGTPKLVNFVSKWFNAVFEERMVGYRIINGEITDIVGEEEQAAVEEAGRESSHIVKAAGLLYDRGENPDYKNAIKESICAVEEMCKKITGKDRATLAGCLQVIESKAPMHSALKDALTKLYGYTSDEDGIRHAGFSGGEVGHAEAKFMLVACSAFCNFLREKQTQQ